MIAAPLPHAPAPPVADAPRLHLAAVRAFVRTALIAVVVIVACGPVLAPDDVAHSASDDIAGPIRIIERASRDVIGLGSRAGVEVELARIRDARQHAERALTRLEASVRDPQGLRLLANARDAAARYQPLERSFERLLREGRTDDARHLLLGDFRPVQLDYFSELKKAARHEERHRLGAEEGLRDGAVPHAFFAVVAGLLLTFYVLGFALWRWLEAPDAQPSAEVQAVHAPMPRSGP